ncbi:MAG: HD domain-containing protein [Candidatus Aenigmarchaeota archaeon]|nr:HD domain-containing protein [Candidatus Aenigmarchaeota archaeon]
MKKQYVNALTQDGDRVDDKFAVKFKKPPVSYRGSDKPGKWFELRLSDKTGEITAKYWGRSDKQTDELYGTIAKGDVVHVTGEVQEYPRGSRLFSISVDAAKGKLRKCQPGEYDITDYVAATKKDVKGMVNEMKVMLSSVRNEHLRALLAKYMEDAKLMQAFMRSPAAMEYHQNYIGGLAEHTLNVMRICVNLCDIHPELDRDLVLTGAFLHDFGKVKEFEVSGGIIDVSHEGMLVGHIIIGYEILSNKINEMQGFPKELGLKLLHIIISHHGRPEYGASKEPQLPEAVAIHHADQCDARVDLFLRLKREANTEDGWLWDKKIKGHIYLR